MSTTPRGYRLADCRRPLAEDYDAGLYDLDGVLYLGRDAVPHAANAVRVARGSGLRAAFVTNNASRGCDEVAAHLSALGIPADPEDIVTSAAAAARLLLARLGAGATVLVLGTDSLAAAVEAVGLRPVRRMGEADTGRPHGLVQGLDPQLTMADLSEACLAIQQGAFWVVGNADATYPSPRGLVPGNGALVAALTTATGAKPHVVGKPAPELHQEAVSRMGSRRPLVIGDRLDTDVLGAIRQEADSLLVLTGVTDILGLLAAPAGSRPSFVAPDLRGLLVAHPPVTVNGHVARCGEATLDLADPLLRASGPLPPGVTVDRLRAACALAWATADGRA